MGRGVPEKDNEGYIPSPFPADRRLSLVVCLAVPRVQLQREREGARESTHASLPVKSSSKGKRARERERQGKQGESTPPSVNEGAASSSRTPPPRTAHRRIRHPHLPARRVSSCLLYQFQVSLPGDFLRKGADACATDPPPPRPDEPSALSGLSQLGRKGGRGEREGEKRCKRGD